MCPKLDHMYMKSSSNSLSLLSHRRLVVVVGVYKFFGVSIRVSVVDLILPGRPTKFIILC